MNPEPKFKNGEIVIAGWKSLKMVVVNGTLCLKGWRYELAFPKKDGTPDRRVGHRWFFESDINKS